jgi:hypothetical protein
MLIRYGSAGIVVLVLFYILKSKKINWIKGQKLVSPLTELTKVKVELSIEQEEKTAAIKSYEEVLALVLPFIGFTHNIPLWEKEFCHSVSRAITQITFHRFDKDIMLFAHAGNLIYTNKNTVEKNYLGLMTQTGVIVTETFINRCIDGEKESVMDLFHLIVERNSNSMSDTEKKIVNA